MKTLKDTINEALFNRSKNKQKLDLGTKYVIYYHRDDDISADYAKRLYEIVEDATNLTVKDTDSIGIFNGDYFDTYIFNSNESDIAKADKSWDLILKDIKKLKQNVNIIENTTNYKELEFEINHSAGATYIYITMNCN